MFPKIGNTIDSLRQVIEHIDKTDSEPMICNIDPVTLSL